MPFCRYTHNLHGLVLRNASDGPVKPQQLPWPVVLKICLLCLCPVERNVAGERYAFAKLSARLLTIADRLRHSIDLVVSCTDDQRLPFRICKSVGDRTQRDQRNQPPEPRPSHPAWRILVPGFRRSSSIAPRYSFRVCRCTWVRATVLSRDSFSRIRRASPASTLRICLVSPLKTIRREHSSANRAVLPSGAPKPCQLRRG